MFITSISIRLSVSTRLPYPPQSNRAARIIKTDPSPHGYEPTPKNTQKHPQSTQSEEIVPRTAPEFPSVVVSHLYVDACCTVLVTDPTDFDVIVSSNLFGDVLSDLTAGLLGSLGALPSASVGGPTSLFEPVHGSAHDLAGQDIANPMAAILSTAMLLRHTGGHGEAACAIESAVDAALAQGLRTKDLLPRAERQNSTGTIEFTNAVLAALSAHV